MRQSKKLILLAALLPWFQSSTQVEAQTVTLNNPTTGVANIGTSVNGTVTASIFNTLAATDQACIALGTSSTALVTSLGLNPLGAFGSAAEFWANQTGIAITSFTNTDGTSITNMTTTFVNSASLSRDLVVGCSDVLGTVTGDANSSTISNTGTSYSFLIEMVSQADWFDEVDDLIVYSEFENASIAPRLADTGTTTFDADWIRPKNPTGVTSRDGGTNLAAIGGTANITATQFAGTGTTNILNFTGGAFDVAGIGSTINMSLAIPGSELQDIAGDGITDVKATFGLSSAITVYDFGTTNDASFRDGGTFHIFHTIAVDQAGGTVLDEGASNVGVQATFYTEDENGNTSSTNQQDLVAAPLTAYLDVIIADKSYQLIAADVSALADGNFVSRGQSGDSNGLAFTPGGTGATSPTLLNLTIDITSGAATASIVYSDASPSHIDTRLGQGETGISVNITDINAAAPVVDPTALVTTSTGTIADGTWSITFGGIDGAGNPLLPLTIANLTGDITPPELANFAPTAVAGDTETGPAEIIARGTNSEALASATINLNCDLLAVGAINASALGWPLGDGVLNTQDAVDTGGVVIPASGAQCTWTWAGMDLAGNAGGETSGLLAAYNPAAAPSEPATISLASGTSTAIAGVTYEVRVQVLDSGGAAVFGIGATANATDIVTISTAFTADDGACSLGTDCTLVFSGTGVTDGGDNSTAILSLQDFASDASLNFTVTGQSTGSNVFSGVLSTDAAVVGSSAGIATTVEASDAIALSLNDPSVNITAGANFWVNVELVDQYTNVLLAAEDFVEVSTNVAGATIPTNAIKIAAGSGGFWASTDNVGAQSIWARNLDVGAVLGDLEGSLTHTLDAVPALTNVWGADVPNDQGSFIYLNISGIAPEANLVRVWRDITDVGSVSYATFVPAPGIDEQVVIVFTPDSEATSYAVTQETANNASDGVDATAAAKQAFASIEGVNSPYELMAETMMQSKQITSSTAPEGPIFATLTPDAIAVFDGITPSFKLGGDVKTSSKVWTEPIRAIDNIAPAAVQQLKAVDTPSDAGGSISVTWQKSVDDRMLTQSTAQAVATDNGTYNVAGVEGYNVYRKAGTSEFNLAGTVSAGETSFNDNTVFNGLRYSYTVSPFDADNITATELERTSMAIRNNVKDASGNLVMGLFGADNSVGFDDFFIFADFFGQTAADVAFDPAFDLNPNNRIDLDDFFVFADYFGRGVNSASRVVPMLAGLNSDASLTLAGGEGLPGIGEEMTIAVGLEDYVELRGYGLNLSFDPTVLELVGSKVEDNLLGEGSLAQPQVITGKDGKASIFAFGETAVDGDLGLSLVFRTKIETEGSYIEITGGQLSDGANGVNDLRGPVSVMVETRPEVYALADNYPNPFNPATTIKYQLPEAGLVTLEVYNMLGQVVRTLVNEHQSAGRYSMQWDASNDKGQSLSSGMYFYHVTAGQEFQSTKKMLLLK